MRVWLDRLPGEVLDPIFALVPVADIFAFMGPATLRESPLVRAAVVNRLKRKPLLFHSHLQQTCLVTYLLTPSFVSKQHMELLFVDNLHLLRLIEATWGADIDHPVTISYHIWNLLSAAEFVALLKCIQGSSLKYNIDLDFDPAILPRINMTHLFSQIAHYGGAMIHSLLISNYHGPFSLDPRRLPKLASLWLQNTDAKFLAPFHPLLKRLYLYPNNHGYANNRSACLKHGLPANATTIILGNCCIEEPSDAYQLPSQLETVSLENVNDWTSTHMVRQMMEQNRGVRSVSLMGSMPLSGLKTLDSFGVSRVPQPTWDLGSTFLASLQISACSLTDMVAPESLRELNISNNGIVDIHRIILPHSLASLKMSDNPIDWSTPIRFPRLLVYLDLNNTGVTELKLLAFPNSINTLILTLNKIESIEGVRFPDKLHFLDISMNHIRKVVNPLLPCNIHTLQFTENSIDTLRLVTDNQGQPLNLKVLFLNQNRIHDFSALHFPSSVEILNLDNNNILALENIELPPRIRDLSFRGCEVSRLCNVTFAPGSRLRALILSLNKIKELNSHNIKLPDSVQLVNLGGNVLGTIDPEFFRNLPLLRYVSLACNNIKSVTLKLPSSLRELDVCCNKIRQLHLRFPHNTSTSLTSVNASQNRLVNFAPSMIGHGVHGTSHDKLVEVDITSNKISDSYMDSVLDDMPESLVACFVGYTGTQDSYGYEIGQNILDHPMCLGKRIDVSTL